MANNFGLIGGTHNQQAALEQRAMDDQRANRSVKPVSQIEGELADLNAATGELHSRLSILIDKIQPVSRQTLPAEDTAGGVANSGPSSPISVAIRGQRENVVSAIYRVNAAIDSLEI